MARCLAFDAGVVSLVGLLALAAYAQDDPNAGAPPAETADATTQPAYVDTSRPPAEPLISFRELTFTLGFESTFDSRTVQDERDNRRTLSFEQTNRAQRFEETIGVSTEGALFSERLFTFDIDAMWGLSQEKYVESGTLTDLSQNPDGNVYEYDIRGVILPYGKLSATVYAQNQDSRLPRAFLPSLERELERYGVDLVFSDAKFPMRLSYEHVWDELTSRTRNLNDDERRGHDKLLFEGTAQFSDNHALRLQYEYEDRTERFSGTDTRFDTQRHYLILDHTLRFGEHDRSLWETFGRIQDESGDLARDTAEFSSRLRLQHTDSFATDYRVQFLRDSYFNLTTRTWRGEIGATHVLDDWLTTTVQAYGLREHSEANADIGEIGGLASFALSRENKYGRFSANLSYNHIESETNDTERQGVVVAESVILRDPLVSYLAHRDVNLASITVSDANFRRTYLPGRDYVAFKVGRFAAIRRIATGAITDNETVLVSYTYDAIRDYNISRDRVDWRVQQDFKIGLTPYYAGSVQNESIDNSDLLRWRARNVNRHRLGVLYRKPRWSAGAEYEYNDDAIDPYQAVHLNGDVAILTKAQHTLDANTRFSYFWFDGSEGLDPRETAYFDIGTSYRYLIMRDLEANASATYRYEEDTILGETHGIDVATGVAWKIGEFSLRFEAEYDMLDLPGSRDQGVAFWIKLQRDFPLIARDAR